MNSTRQTPDKDKYNVDNTVGSDGVVNNQPPTSRDTRPNGCLVVVGTLVFLEDLPGDGRKLHLKLLDQLIECHHELLKRNGMNAAKRYSKWFRASLNGMKWRPQHVLFLILMSWNEALYNQNVSHSRCIFLSRIWSFVWCFANNRFFSEPTHYYIW